jgi:hypothetical protein
METDCYLQQVLLQLQLMAQGALTDQQDCPRMLGEVVSSPPTAHSLNCGPDETSVAEGSAVVVATMIDEDARLDLPPWWHIRRQEFPAYRRDPCPQHR